MTLGERIQKYRKMKGLSQEELGKLPNVAVKLPASAVEI